MKFRSSFGSSWNGRILLQLSLEKSKNPVSLTEKISDHSISDYIYQNYEKTESVELECFVIQAAGVPSNFSEYSCRVAFGEFSVSTKLQPASNKICKWNEKLPRKLFEIPKKSLNDVLIYLENTRQEKVCFQKLAFNDLIKPKNSWAQWVELISDRSVNHQINKYESGFVQIIISLSKGQPKNLLKGFRLNSQRKKIVLLFNLYQGRDFPFTDLDGKSDPFIEIFAEGSSGESSVRTNTLNPIWYEVIRLEFELGDYLSSFPLIVYIKDRDLISSEIIDSFTLFLDLNCLNQPNPVQPVWHQLQKGELLFSVNLFDSFVSQYDIRPEFVEAELQINCLGLRDLAANWLPVNKAFIKFDVNSLNLNQSTPKDFIKTQPNESGRNPNISSVLKINFMMPKNPTFAPCLTCLVYDWGFGGLSQPQIGSFSIDLGQIKEREEEIFDCPKKLSKIEDVNIDLNTEIDTTRMINAKSEVSISEAREGKFKWNPIYEKDSFGRIREMVKPDKSYLKLGYNRKPGDSMVHYRYCLDSPLEDSIYIEKSFFDQYKIKSCKKIIRNLLFNEKYEETFAGSFKAMVKIQKIGEPAEENNEFINVQKMILQKKPVILRLYIVKCLNLAQKDMKSQSDPYLIIKLGKTTINDSHNCQQNQPNPKFLKCFDIPSVLPGSSSLKIQLWDRDDFFADEKIGSTKIDIEERYFSSKFQSISEKPIETRPLFLKSSKLQQGSILIWLEFHNPSSLPPQVDISEKPPEDYEIRLIIWQTEGVKSQDFEDTSDLYVKADLNNSVIKETDTHYRCQTGSGQFNWRILFDFRLPSESCLINLQIWDRDLISRNDFIGDCVIDFKHLAWDCFELSNGAKMHGENVLNTQIKGADRFWLDCSKVKENGTQKTGRIQVSLELVPKKVSLVCPVGEGRKEPNVNPFLPPPSGRFQWTLNPFKLVNQTCGPRFKGKVFAFVCCVFCVYLMVMVGPSILGTLIGSIF